MREDKSWIDNRAETLAFLYLTRRDDLVLTTMRDDYGLNSLVYLCKDGMLTPRMFGVQVKGSLSLSSEVTNRNTEVLWHNVRPVKWHPEQLIPMCFFVFNVQSDEGFYGWLHAPVITNEGRPELHLPAHTTLLPLDRAALDTIVDQVQAWYAAQGQLADPVALTADE